jgi:hypothetical protein
MKRAAESTKNVVRQVETMTKFFGGWDVALRRPDGAARRSYQGK